jgi:hypothetical protein
MLGKELNLRYVRDVDRTGFKDYATKVSLTDFACSHWDNLARDFATLF